jgi:hypothetical protein
VDDAAKTVQFTLTLTGSVFGGAAPAPITLTGTYDASALTISASTATMGNIAATIRSNGTLTAAITGIPGGSISRVDVLGTVTGTTMNARYTVTFVGGGTAQGTLTLAKPA